MKENATLSDEEVDEKDRIKRQTTGTLASA
jgi:hypothetical protein